MGNDFYALFLDDALMYSCAWFQSSADTLETAQMNKLQAIIQKAQIQASDHVLEIGCGWGSFAIEAVKQTGCKVTAITLSKAQYETATARVKEAGIEDCIVIKLIDYRKISGTFDKIISIEMMEAVGHENYKFFFQQCERLLKPEGLMVLQVITMPDYRYNVYRKERDWTQKHILPGGLIPSLSVLSHAMAKHSHFIIEHAENIGIHYARTLREWRMRYLENIEKASALGFDDAFHRKWRYYLSICEAEFARRILNDMQLVLTRPNNPNLPSMIAKV
jgi:cyclopropane-fatty-acyl-phospholipid synthase